MENPRRRLSLVVFLAGVASLATEVTGARLLAPYFGTSNVVWANVIGMTLLYLSLGYWLGGRLADRHPNERALAGVVMVAAVTVAILPFATRPLFDAATGRLRRPLRRRLHRLVRRHAPDVRHPDHVPRAPSRRGPSGWR